MTEADTEDGQSLTAQFGDRGRAHACVLGPARARRHEQSGGVEGPQTGHVHGIVADDDGIGPELAEVLDEVVDEAVVVVDDRHLDAHRRRGYRQRESWLSSKVVARTRAGSDDGASSKKRTATSGRTTPQGGRATPQGGRATPPGSRDVNKRYTAPIPKKRQAQSSLVRASAPRAPRRRAALDRRQLRGHHARRYEQLVPHRRPDRDRHRRHDGHPVSLTGHVPAASAQLGARTGRLRAAAAWRPHACAGICHELCGARSLPALARHGPGRSSGVR